MRTITIPLGQRTTHRLCGDCPGIMYADGMRAEVVGSHVITYAGKDLFCRVFGVRLRSGLMQDGLERCHTCRGYDSIEGNEVKTGSADA